MRSVDVRYGRLLRSLTCDSMSPGVAERYAGQRWKGLCTPRAAVPARWAAHKVRGSCPGLAACEPEGECPGQEPFSFFFGCTPCSEVGSLGL